MARNQAFEALQKINFVQITSQSFSSSGWNAEGSGVVTTFLSESILVFEEVGELKLENQRRVRFRNTYRWSRLKDGSLRLEHLRQGPKNPLHFFDLHRIDEKNWRSANAHLCGKDTYDAELEIDEAQKKVILKWSVKGERKNEKVLCLYFAK